MAFWVELMCDVRADGPPDPTRTEPLCYSDRRILIGRLVANGSMAYGKRVLEAEAKLKGWQWSRANGWMCPACKTVKEQ